MPRALAISLPPEILEPVRTRSSDLATSSSHRRPASMILIRPTAIALPVSLCTVASPARTSVASIGRVKPWTCMIASVTPNGLQASNRSARRCSPPRRFRGLTVIVCDIVASRKSPADSGGASQGISVSESFAGDCRVASTVRSSPPESPSLRHRSPSARSHQPAAAEADQREAAAALRWRRAGCWQAAVARGGAQLPLGTVCLSWERPAISLARHGRQQHRGKPQQQPDRPSHRLLAGLGQRAPLLGIEGRFGHFAEPERSQ
jgi:hypothetical protein